MNTMNNTNITSCVWAIGLAATLILTSCVSNKTAYGIYRAEYQPPYIEIEPDTLYLLGTELYMPCWGNEVYGREECTYSYEGDFITFSSIHKPMEYVFNHTNILKLKTNLHQKTTTLVFNCPDRPDCIIDLYYYKNIDHYESYLWTDKRIEIELPGIVESFEFSIRPIIYYYQGYNGQYTGVLYARFPQKIDCINIDRILMVIPYFNDTYFTPYYYMGETFQIKDNIINWNGIQYKKIKKSQKDKLKIFDNERYYK